MRTYLDIEGFSEIDLKESGGFAYAQHPSTDVLCVGLKYEGYEAGIWAAGRDSQQLLIELLERATVFVAHNASFDREVLIRWLTRKGLLTDKIFNTPWEDTMARAYACALPGSLDDLSTFFGEGGKDKTGYAVMLRLCRPKRATKADPRTRIRYEEEPETFATLFRYCLKDVEDLAALDQKWLMRLEGLEPRVLRLTEEINAEGVMIDRNLAAWLDTQVDAFKADSAAKALNTYGFKGTQVKEVKSYIERRLGVPINSISKTAIEALRKEHGTMPDDVEDLLRIRSLSGKNSTAKTRKMLSFSEHDGRVRGHLVYAGAKQTKRFAGYGPQFQNLPRGVEELDTTAWADYVVHNLGMHWGEIEYLSQTPFMEFAASLLRSCIVADPGCNLIGVDWSAIEAVILAWYAEAGNRLQIFKDGRDIYRETAGSFFLTAPENVSKEERSVGKAAELAFGFGGGVGAFGGFYKGPDFTLAILKGNETAIKYVEWAIDRRAMTLHEAICAWFVKVWRDQNPEVKKFWGAVEELARSVASGVRDNAPYVNSQGRTMFEFVRTPYGMANRLPSGSLIHYVGAKIEHGDLVCYSENRWDYLYGGLLVENVVQATSRELLVHSLDRMADAFHYDLSKPVGVARDTNFPQIALHVHDEIVINVRKEHTQWALDVAVGIMKSAPEWATGLPLNVSHWIGERFKK